jgi:hypothetical protein
MKTANIDITLTGNMLLDIWKKFVLLSGTYGMTASTRQPLGLIREDTDMHALLFKRMHATIAVGRAAGVDLPEDFAAEFGSIDSGLSANHENVNGERPRGRQAPRTGWRGRWSRLAVSMVCQPRRRRRYMRSSNLTGRG